MKVRLAGALLGFSLAAAFLVPGLLSGRVPARGDLPDFFWPMKAYTAERWRSGAPPLWNPLSGCGEPWLAQLQSGVFYPGDAAFLLPWPFGPPATVALHLVIAATGMATWLSALGRSRLAALTGAAVYAGGGVFLSLVPVFNNFATAAWLPWVFLGARRAARGEGVATLAASSALAFLAGEPALAAGGSLAAAAVAFASPAPAGPATGRRGVARLAGGLLLAAGLTAATAVPFVIHLRESGRLTGATRAEAVGRAVGGSDLSDLLWPPPPALTRTGAAGRGSYLATLALGPLPILLACAGVAAGDRRTTLALLLLALLGLLLSLGARGGLAPFLWSAGPLRGARFPARWFAFPHLVVAVLGAVGVDAVRDDAAPPRRGLLLAALGLAAAGLLGIARLDPLRLQGDGGVRAVLALGAAAAGLWLLRRRPSAEVAFLGILGGPLVWFSSDALASVQAADLIKAPAIVSGATPSAGRLFVAAHDASLLSRWLAGGGTAFSDETVRRGHEALAGYGNLGLGLATAGTASPIDSPRRARLLGAALAGGSPGALFALADVRQIVTPFPTTIAGAVPVASVGAIRRYELPGAVGRAFLPREVRAGGDDDVFEALRRPGFAPEEVAWVASSPVPLPPRRTPKAFFLARFLRDEPERAELAVSTSEPGLVVLTRSFDSGWRARLDGAPVPALRADLAFLGVLVPAGDHRVELEYRPPGYRTGLAISGASFVLLAALVLAGPSPLRRRP